MSELNDHGFVRLSTVNFDFKTLISTENTAINLDNANASNTAQYNEYNHHVMRIQSIQTGYGLLVDYSDGQVGRVDICECFDSFDDNMDCSTVITNKFSVNELKIGRYIGVDTFASGTIYASFSLRNYNDKIIDMSSQFD